MSVVWETATLVKNGVTYWLKDEKARTLLKECYSPSNPPPAPSGVLPPGGTTGQVPKKRSNSDYDIEWADESGGGAANTWYATCSTDAGVGGKTAVSATGDFSLVTGSMVRVLFSKANIASNPTLSVDGSTAKNIRPVSTASGMDYMWKAGEVVDLVYDGSNFVMTKGGKADTSFYGITKLSNSTNSSATDVAATSKAVKDVNDAIPAASSATPQNLGTAAPGSSSDFSRADHVHQKPTYSKTDVGLGNVDNVQQYSASNPPPYPVTSVNGQTGAVTVPAVAVQDTTPTGDELVWIDTDDDGSVHQVLELSDFDSASGHCKMPDGTLIQWGVTSFPSGATSGYVSPISFFRFTVTFPIPFVDTNYCVWGSGRYSSGMATPIGFVGAASTTVADFFWWDAAARTFSSTYPLIVKWTAIGRWR